MELIKLKDHENFFSFSKYLRGEIHEFQTLFVAKDIVFEVQDLPSQVLACNIGSILLLVFAILCS